MKRILRLYEKDIKNILVEYFNCRPSEILSIYTEEQDETGDIVPIFYIEVEEDAANARISK